MTPSLTSLAALSAGSLALAPTALAQSGLQLQFDVLDKDNVLLYDDDTGSAGSFRVLSDEEASGTWFSVDARVFCPLIQSVIDNPEAEDDRQTAKWRGWIFLRDPLTVPVTGPELLIDVDPDGDAEYGYSSSDWVQDVFSFNTLMSNAQHQLTDSLAVIEWCQPLLYTPGGVTTTVFTTDYHRWRVGGNANDAWDWWNQYLIDPGKPEVMSFEGLGRGLIIEQAAQWGIAIDEQFFNSELYNEIRAAGLEMDYQVHSIRGEWFDINTNWQAFPQVDNQPAIDGLRGSAPHRKGVSGIRRIRLSGAVGEGNGNNIPKPESATNPAPFVPRGTAYHFNYIHTGGTNAFATVRWSDDTTEDIPIRYVGGIHQDRTQLIVPQNAPLGLARIIYCETLDGLIKYTFDGPSEDYYRLEVTL